LSTNIEFSVDEFGVAVLKFNRPEKLNALTSEMMDEELPRLCEQVSKDKAIRALVLTGAGRGFCTGADVESRLAMVSASVVKEPLGSFSAPVARLDKPVIAAINGIAAGGGMALALLADFRFASSEARFTTAFARRGLSADTGMSLTLPRLVGLEKALELLLTAEIIDAAEALRIGLVGRVSPASNLMNDVVEFARTLAKGPPIAQSFIKRAVYAGFHNSFAQQLEVESWGQGVCMKSADYAEGRAAFLEKRDPVFKGQ
jgi:2-(1,2-epoxy-1,2-dihydrophenyl)acetyl-CoA isomerase